MDELILARHGESVFRAHSLPVAYALGAAEGRPPKAKVDLVPYAEPFRLSEGHVRAAAALLETWSASPAF